MQDFVNAADSYEQLTLMQPDVEEYRLYYAQALHKACLYQEAMKVACQIDNPAYQGQVHSNSQWVGEKLKGRGVLVGQIDNPPYQGHVTGGMLSQCVAVKGRQLPFVKVSAQSIMQNAKEHCENVVLFIHAYWWLKLVKLNHSDTNHLNLIQKYGTEYCVSPAKIVWGPVI